MAIDNPSIRRRILEPDPPPDTLDAALTAAVRLEALDITEDSISQATLLKSGGQYNLHQPVRSQSILAEGHGARCLSTDNASARMQALESNMAAIQAQLQELVSQQTVNRTSMSQNVLSPQADAGVPTPPQTSHWLPDNVQPSAPTWNRQSAPGGVFKGRGGGGRLPRDMCKLCHQQGHWARECPTKGAPPPNDSAGTSAITREVHSTSPASDTYIEISVKSKKYNVLTDTRSDRSLMPRRLMPGVSLQPSDIKLYAANGTEMRNLGTLVFKYQIGSMTLQSELVVSDEIDELIFGFYWLIMHQCILKNGLSMSVKKPERLCMRNSHANIRRVYVREDTLIAPGAEVNVPVSLA
jgi:hypothetical protein